MAILAAAMVGFGIYGAATGAKSTGGYVISVAVVGALVWRVRRTPLPGPLVITLAVDAALHLAGGLVAVGNDVLYNASIGPRVTSLHTHILQYDHFVHAFGAFLATPRCGRCSRLPRRPRSDRRNVMVLCVIAGLGIGAVNEVIEFLATIARQRRAHRWRTTTRAGISCRTPSARSRRSRSCTASPRGQPARHNAGFVSPRDRQH